MTKRLAQLPAKPGVYKMLSESGVILYVGKAKNLKNRVRSYFQKGQKHGVKTQKLVEKIADIEWIETASEVEALVLENNLIKEFQPRYNVLLRDDKNFLYIKITNDDFPIVTTTRKIEKDGAKYFGPKTSSDGIKQTLKLLQQLFPFRDCSLKISENEKEKNGVLVIGSGRKIPCLLYHIKRCLGPCIGAVTKSEYRLMIDRIASFLSGKYEEIVKELKQEMMKAASDKRFEIAAKLRDRIFSIEKIMTQNQSATDTEAVSRDVIGFVTDFGKSFFNLFQVRDGKLIGQETFVLSEADSPEEVLSAFLTEYYSRATDFPKEILLPFPVEELDVFAEWMRISTGGSVKFLTPMTGKKNKLLEMAERNAASFAEREKASWESDEAKTTGALKELAEVLKIEPPKRIECYDISHLSGTNTVASMVVFIDGKPKKGDYRQFRLRTIGDGEIDDFKSMHETLARRFRYLKAEKESSFKMRKATKKDLKAWEEILKKEKLEWPILTAEFPNETFFVAIATVGSGKGKKKAEEEIVGTISLADWDERFSSLHKLFVRGKWRKQGIGSSLIRYACERAKHPDIYLATDPKKEDWYTKNGFSIVKTVTERLQKMVPWKVVPNPIWLHAKRPEKADSSFTSHPDLIVIDGGKGQLSFAMKAMEESDIKAIPMVSLAKREEEVFVPGKPEPILLPSSSEGSYLLQRIRDEAHRFAVGFNRSVRGKEALSSKFDEIPGIGPQNRRKLLAKFGSADGVKNAGFADIAVLVGPALAEKLKKML